MSYNQKTDRTFRIDGSVSIANKTAVFVQGMTVSMDAGVFQRDYMGDGESVFTQNGDVLGSFSFSLKNTVSLYDPSTTPTLNETVSFWNKAIADYSPAIIAFIQTLKAPKSTGSKFARIRFSGRIMKPDIVMSVDNAIEDVIVNGEITTYTSSKRESS